MSAYKLIDLEYRIHSFIIQNIEKGNIVVVKLSCSDMYKLLSSSLRLRWLYFKLSLPPTHPVSQPPRPTHPDKFKFCIKQHISQKQSFFVTAVYVYYSKHICIATITPLGIKFLILIRSIFAFFDLKSGLLGISSFLD